MTTIGRAVLGDQEISVDLNIADAEPTPVLLDRAEHFVTRLADFDGMARAALGQRRDQAPPPAVALYVSHHLEELSAELLTKIFDKPKDAVTVDDFLGRLVLRGVGLHLSNRDGYGMLDYTIGADVTQYILAVRIDEAGEVLGVEMES